MKIEKFKRLARENFDDQFKSLVDKLAYSINPAMEQIINALSNNLTIGDNFRQGIKTIEVRVDNTGSPISKTQFKSDLPTGIRVQGLQVVYASNGTNSSTYPTNTPFISFDENDGLITVNNITGLSQNDKWTLRFIIISG